MKKESKRKFNHLTFTDRLRIEEGLRHKLSMKAISEELGVHISTIYREIKRGLYEKKEKIYDRYYGDVKGHRYKTMYCPDIAEEKYKQNLQAKGSPLKIGNDFELSNYIEKEIIENGRTPLAVIGRIKKENLPFSTSICVRTLYNYIDKGVFLNLTLQHLPLKGRRKRKTRVLRPAKVPRGESIEKRPVEINNRTSFGHWEMDCVCDKKKKVALLTLNERLTRKEIIVRIPSQTSACVVKALDILEKKYGKKRFKKVFKSITVDNGSEFSDCQGMERSIFNPTEQRTKMYYCHPYCSSERGTNERMNREIRRKIPKGTNLVNISAKEVQSIEDWINNYPRGVLNYATANEVFNLYMANL